MSNDKPTATATIRFYPNKHVEVNLSSIKNITPRTLAIASNILLKEYRGMKGKFNAEQHKIARELQADNDAKAVKDDEKFHKKEDKRLITAAKTAEKRHEKALDDMPQGEDSDATVEEVEETETTTETDGT